MRTWSPRRITKVGVTIGLLGMISGIGLTGVGNEARATAHVVSASANVDTISSRSPPRRQASLISPTRSVHPASHCRQRAQRKARPSGAGLRMAPQAFPAPASSAWLLGDPRIALTEEGLLRSFHFGVDVSAPDGTPVFATISGRVQIPASHHDTVTILAPDGTEFEYWHVVANVRSGDYVTAYRTRIGRIEKPWAHVHFAERRNGAYLNPLRPGAMGPCADETCPAIREVRFEHEGVEQRNRT